MLFAGPLGFKEEPYYEDADASIQSAPKVEFARPGLSPCAAPRWLSPGSALCAGGCQRRRAHPEL